MRAPILLALALCFATVAKAVNTDPNCNDYWKPFKPVQQNYCDYVDAQSKLTPAEKQTACAGTWALKPGSSTDYGCYTYASTAYKNLGGGDGTWTEVTAD